MTRSVRLALTANRTAVRASPHRQTTIYESVPTSATRDLHKPSRDRRQPELSGRHSPLRSTISPHRAALSKQCFSRSAQRPSSPDPAPQRSGGVGVGCSALLGSTNALKVAMTHLRRVQRLQAPQPSRTRCADTKTWKGRCCSRAALRKATQRRPRRVPTMAGRRR